MSYWRRNTEREDAYLALYFDGYSFGKIAKQFATTRSTVAGVVWRATRTKEQAMAYNEKRCVRERARYQRTKSRREGARQGRISRSSTVANSALANQ